MRTIKRVGIIVNPKISTVPVVIQELENWFRERNIEFELDNETASIVNRQGIPKSEIPKCCDLIVAMGGDGTLLSVARILKTHLVPILAVNLGSLGFLTEITLEEMFPTLELVIAGKATLQQRMMIDVSVIRAGKCINSYQGLNDVVINKGVLARIIDINVKIDNNFVATYKADGIIVGTPTGSTAYTLSAGGSILYPTLDAMVVTPIASHTLTFRSLVVPDSSVVELSLKPTQESIFMTVDGQIGLNLQGKDRVSVKKSSNYVELIQSPEKSFFDILRQKLKWGER
ncbi:MAG: NAD(+)/NADH kinase [Acidobacteriia bacterium]|jgi:NAD+ kinase|nr:NAD(+)/NADH kinase [Terriglobia bacterium]